VEKLGFVQLLPPPDDWVVLVLVAVVVVVVVVFVVVVGSGAVEVPGALPQQVAVIALAETRTVRSLLPEQVTERDWPPFSGLVPINVCAASASPYIPRELPISAHRASRSFFIRPPLPVATQNEVQPRQLPAGASITEAPPSRTHTPWFRVRITDLADEKPGRCTREMSRIDTFPRRCW